MNAAAAIINSDLTLRQLLDGLATAPDIPVTGISSDSRKLRKGDVFIACQRAAGHGLYYADQAIAAGASAIVWDSSTGNAAALRNVSVPAIAVDDLAAYLGEIANRFYGYPSRDLTVFGVTGTNGKTTVALLVAQCLKLLGYTSAYIGTLGSGIDELAAADMTTPDCIDLHRLLAEFRAAGATHVALEVSSHALQQNRINGIAFDTTAFTNLSRDHLDYHGGMQSYGETKAILLLDSGAKHQVINIDSEFGRQLIARCDKDAIAVSCTDTPIAADQPHVVAASITAHSTGSDVLIRSSWGNAELALPLVGDFNVANAMLAIAVLLQFGVTLEQACAAMTEVTPPAGRMQPVILDDAESLPTTIIDFAHTAAGLDVVLRTLRKHCAGKLWCVFGCGGDRDRGKRSDMGNTAATLADRLIITNDNPRSEQPAEIFKDILEGIAATVVADVVEDRAAAIAFAVQQAAVEDTILIAGKGHEPYQIIGAKRLPFLDYEVARAHLAARAARNAEVL